MGYQIDLDSSGPRTRIPACRPGSVRHFYCAAWPGNRLLLLWEAPVPGAAASSYCIKRTREGKRYEVVGRTRECRFVVRVAPGEPWFYRVYAVNARGECPGRVVCFYRAGDRFVRGGHNVKPLLQHISVVPGLSVTVCEYGPSE